MRSLRGDALKCARCARPPSFRLQLPDWLLLVQGRGAVGRCREGGAHVRTHVCTHVSCHGRQPHCGPQLPAGTRRMPVAACGAKRARVQRAHASTAPAGCRITPPPPIDIACCFLAAIPLHTDRRRTHSTPAAHLARSTEPAALFRACDRAIQQPVAPLAVERQQLPGSRPRRAPQRLARAASRSAAACIRAPRSLRRLPPARRHGRLPHGVQGA